MSVAVIDIPLPSLWNAEKCRKHCTRFRSIYLFSRCKPMERKKSHPDTICFKQCTWGLNNSLQIKGNKFVHIMTPLSGFPASECRNIANLLLHDDVSPAIIVNLWIFCNFLVSKPSRGSNFRSTSHVYFSVYVQLDDRRPGDQGTMKDRVASLAFWVADQFVFLFFLPPLSLFLFLFFLRKWV